MPLVHIAKTNEPKGLVYGFANIVQNADGSPVVDLEGHIIEPETLEDAAVDFMLHHRATGEMHVGGANGTIVESLVASPAKYEAMGFPAEVAKAMPTGLWIGVKVDKDVFARVKNGTYKAFSIHGYANEVPA